MKSFRPIARCMNMSDRLAGSNSEFPSFISREEQCLIVWPVQDHTIMKQHHGERKCLIVQPELMI